MRQALLALLVPIACSSGQVSSLDQLQAPWYAVTSHGVDTSSTIAVDADGNVWRRFDSVVRPSAGFAVVAGATAAQRATAASAFAKLPLAPGPCTFAAFVTLKADTAAGGVQTWTACGDGAGGLAEPYADASNSVTVLAPP